MFCSNNDIAWKKKISLNVLKFCNIIFKCFFGVISDCREIKVPSCISAFAQCIEFSRHSFINN